ncbi:HNH nuclease [Arthrobacter crystallopoietes BAB-32]|uniref:HNH nuclease n=1 Tax=Arthrobacter crystallopoietes BAB-32 TaxID=1246476 RepID=N1UUD2_9MICC|nr:HNH nuclease [Arthrobacter crystallopoietes BAB-32]
MENLKSSACALQAADAVALDRSRREADAAAGIKPEKQGQGVGRQIALARRESPHRAGRLLGMSRTLVNEMPHTFAALQTGELNEWRATILVKETACLSLEDRAAVDASVAGDPATLEGVGNKELTARAQQAAYALDPHAQVKRAAKAETERYVSCRPAPDTMTWVSALLPVKAGVAVHAALTREADSLRARGDQRSRGQIMADTLVERVTGKTAAQPANYEIQLVMTDRTLLQGATEPAHLTGYGIVPAQYARNLLRGTNTTTSSQDPPPADAGAPVIGGPGTGSAAPPLAMQDTAPPRPLISPAPENPPAAPQEANRPDLPDTDFKVWVRRLFTAPGTGQLVGMDSRARLMPAGLRRFIQARDAICRTPWCDAPIRHFDHIIAFNDGGETSAANGEGYCENCNLTKEANGWQAREIPADRHTVEITTPTGHTYTSTAPALPGTPPGQSEAASKAAGMPAW